MANETTTLLLLSLSLLGLAGCNPGTDASATTASPKVEPKPDESAPRGATATEPKSAEPTAAEPTAEPTRVGAPMLGTSLPAVRQPQGCQPPPTTNECPPSRLVGRFAGACPPAYAGDPPAKGPRWLVEPMFALGGNQYCRYVWTGAADSPAPLADTLQKQLGPDCRVYAQSPLAGALAGANERAFAEGTQAPVGQPVDGHPVMIAVVDTAPASTSMGQSEHGRAVAAIAAKLAGGCVPGLGEADCRRSVISELGLPQTRSGVDTNLGGYFGYQSELAQGIMVALDRVPLDDRKLVLNLAVGWEPKPDELSSPTPAVQAVREAIAVAHCRGAAILAASGNRPPGNACVTQGTAPGTWASQPGWTAAQCSGLGLAGNQINLPSPLHAHHPFLHAATPLDWDGGNLADFREGSNARVAATGFGGFETRMGTSYGPMTGSSVSTAVLSGVTALVWSYFPDIGADAVMQLIYDSGTPTSQTASLVLPPASQQLAGTPQRQASACGALQHACTNWQNYTVAHAPNPAAQPSVCATLTTLCPDRPSHVDAQAWENDFEQALAQLADSQVGRANGPVWTTLQCVGCNNQPRFVQLPPGVASEPVAQAWVVPQPQAAPCPICKIKKPTNEIFLSLDPVYDSHTLLEMTVTLTDASGATEVLYYPATTLPPLNSTSVQVVTDPQLAGVGTSGATPIRAYVKMKFSLAGTVVSAGNAIPLY
jgi:subtilisin family serine protease